MIFGFLFQTKKAESTGCLDRNGEIMGDEKMKRYNFEKNDCEMEECCAKMVESPTGYWVKYDAHRFRVFEILNEVHGRISSFKRKVESLLNHNF